MKLRSFALSDIGRRRESNQDRYICNDGFKLYAVADGMGGHVGGGIASQMAVEALGEIFSKRQSIDPAVYLTKAFEEVNSKIFNTSSQTTSLKGMGTTLTALFFSYDTAYFAHVGDSRAYFMKDEMIWQLSIDHSLVSQQMVSGMRTPLRNIITRSIGFDPQVQVDFYTKKTAAGDIYLLCSDGLYNAMEDSEIVSIVSKNSVEDSVKELVRFANQRGGDDNITAVVVKVERL
jgi:protein phosphatase